MARIMIYGYESKLLDSDNTQDLDALGNKFANSLSELALSSTRRPIIVIAHSLGGLIVKKVKAVCRIHVPVCSSMSDRVLHRP